MGGRPSDVDYWTRLVREAIIRGLCRCGRFDEVHTRLDQLPHNEIGVETFIALANVYADRGLFVKAKEYAESAVKVDNFRGWDAWVAIARAYARENMDREARNIARQFPESYHESAAYTAIAAETMEFGDFSAAYDAVERTKEPWLRASAYVDIFVAKKTIATKVSSQRR